MTAPVALPAPETDLVKEVERRSGQNVWACYQCGKCTADCPFSLTPNLVMRLMQLGQVESARALDTTWQCASCFTCEAGCPKGVSPYRVMKALRSLENGREPVAIVPVGASPDAFAIVRARRRTFGERFRAWRLRMRARMFARMPALFRIGSKLTPLSNWLAKIPGARTSAHVFAGVHRKRPLPVFAGESFPAWFAKHTPAGDGHRGPLMLFHDTFMDTSYPQVGIAATELLEKVGYAVELSETGCCGRPAISKGLNDVAAGCAQKNVAALREKAKKGVLLVGTEPSCLLSFRGEYPHLVEEQDEETAQLIARQSFLVDELLLDLHEKGELDLKFRAQDEPKPVLFHGHCHQKAHANPHASIALLELAGYDVEMANAACCGMAGAYGFEKEHYEPSRQAGERALFPAIRARPEADLVVMGVSCRQQIEHFLERPVRHVVEVLREAVE